MSFTIVYSQNSKTIEIKGSSITKTRGFGNLNKSVDDTKIIPSPVNITSKISVNIDNSTGYYVDIFIDNVYRGTIDAWGKTTVICIKPFKNIYCKTMSETKEWSKTGDFTTSTSIKLE